PRFRIRQRVGSKPRPSTPRPPARPRLEALEDRLAPAVQLLYLGAGTPMSLQELVGGATPSVRISEPTPGRLKIDLGASTFAPTSSPELGQAGVIYQNATPETSHFATVNISQLNYVPSLQATLPGDALTLGVIANASGGLGDVAASADVIAVTGLDTSHAMTGLGNVDLKAAVS